MRFGKPTKCIFTVIGMQIPMVNNSTGNARSGMAFGKFNTDDLDTQIYSSSVYEYAKTILFRVTGRKVT